MSLFKTDLRNTECRRKMFLCFELPSEKILSRVRLIISTTSVVANQFAKSIKSKFS